MNIRRHINTLPHAGYTLLAELDRESGELVVSGWADPPTPDDVAASLAKLGIPARLLTFPSRYCVEILPMESN